MIKQVDQVSQRTITVSVRVYELAVWSLERL